MQRHSSFTFIQPRLTLYKTRETMETQNAPPSLTSSAVMLVQYECPDDRGLNPSRWLSQKWQYLNYVSKNEKEEKDLFIDPPAPPNLGSISPQILFSSLAFVTRPNRDKVSFRKSTQRGFSSLREAEEATYSLLAPASRLLKQLDRSTLFVLKQYDPDMVRDLFGAGA